MSSNKSERADQPSVHCGDEHAWRSAGLLPLLLQAPPRHALQATFDKHSKKHAKGGINSIHAGEVVDLAKLTAPPELEWPLDSDEPEAKWTVACVDVDDPDPSLLSPPSSHHRVESTPDYRQTAIAGASTPPAQRIVWLVCNVPGPTLMHNGHLVAEWEVDKEEIEKKQALHRFALFVFKQVSSVSPRHVSEHSLDAKDHRQASLSHWIHKHIAASHSWAGTFFFTDTQSDEAYKRAKRVAEMMKPIDLPKLPAGAKHGLPHLHTPAAAAASGTASHERKE